MTRYQHPILASLNLTISLLSIQILASCGGPTLPDKWLKLGIPTENIVGIDEATNDDGLFIEYDSGTITPQGLYERIDSLLRVAGYKHCCTTLNGIVRGYTNSQENLVVKVDGIAALSIFNQNAGDELMYGLCFKGYILGKEEKIPSHEFDSLLKVEVLK